jgi:hypothetical protein
MSMTQQAAQIDHDCKMQDEMDNQDIQEDFHKDEPDTICRVTGRPYNAQAEFVRVMNLPEIIAVMVRLKNR